MPNNKIPPRTPKVLTSEDRQNLRSQNVRVMVSTKTSLKSMAELLGITVTELRRDYRKELNSGHDYVYAAISLKLVNAAMQGDVRSMLAWMRQFGGWTEVTRREITGRDGEPISFRNLDTASLAAVIDALGAQKVAGGSAGRITAQIDAREGEVVDLEPISGSTD